VRVADRAAEPGGALRLVARLPGRARFGDLADWLTAECRRLGVRFELGAEVAEVVGHAVLATGSRPRPPEFPASEGCRVLTAAEVLAGEVLAGAELPVGPVVVQDPLGGPVGVGVAELLARRGREVAVVTPDPVVGERLGGDLVPANARLARLGVRRETAAVLCAVVGGTAVLADRWTGALRELPCAVLVDAGPPLAENSLARDGAVLLVGDAVAPRTVLEAVLEGRRAAQALLGGD
jgi:2,4-dienoyl-CoA reductase (NADPH2)